jgi:hypothetical protein
MGNFKIFQLGQDYGWGAPVSGGLPTFSTGPSAADLVGYFIAASLAARRTIIETVITQPNIDLSLAGATVFFAVALVFGHVALHAAVFILGCCGHVRTLARA